MPVLTLLLAAALGQFTVTPGFVVRRSPLPPDVIRFAEARRPKPEPKPSPRRPEPVKSAPVATWRVPPDNPAIEVLSSDGRTYSAWRYRAGYAPAAHRALVSPGVGFGAVCPPGGT